MPRRQTLTVQQLAKIIRVTPRYVQKLTTDGILRRAYDEDGKELRGRYSLLSIGDYCDYLRSLAHVDDASQQSWEASRNVRAAADAEMSQLRLREYKGELHEGRHIDFIWTNMLTYFKQRLLAIPSRVSRQCVGKNFRQIYDLIMSEIEQALRELASYSKAMFAKQRAEYLQAQGVEVENLDGENGEEQIIET